MAQNAPGMLRSWTKGSLCGGVLRQSLRLATACEHLAVHIHRDDEAQLMSATLLRFHRVLESWLEVVELRQGILRLTVKL